MLHTQCDNAHNFMEGSTKFGKLHHCNKERTIYLQLNSLTRTLMALVVAPLSNGLIMNAYFIFLTYQI